MAGVLVVTVRKHFNTVFVCLSIRKLGRDQPSVPRRDLRRQVVGVRIAAYCEIHRVVLAVWIVVESIAEVLLYDFVRVLCCKGLYAPPTLKVAIVSTLNIAGRAINDLRACLPYQFELLLLEGRCLPPVRFLLHSCACVHVRIKHPIRLLLVDLLDQRLDLPEGLIIGGIACCAS